MKHGSLPPGWKTTELLPDDPRVLKHLKEVESIAKALSAIPRQKIPLPTHFNGKLISDLSHSEKEEFYLSLQPESTKGALLAQKSRKIDDDSEHFLRPLPNEEDWKRDRETKRDISPDEFLLYKSMQKAEKNTIGQSLTGSVDSDKRLRGIEAFTYSKPANPSDGDLMRLKELTPFKAITPAEPEAKPRKKKPWWKFWGETRPLTDEELDEFLGRK